MGQEWEVLSAEAQDNGRFMIDDSRRSIDSLVCVTHRSLFTKARRLYSSARKFALQLHTLIHIGVIV